MAKVLVEFKNFTGHLGELAVGLETTRVERLSAFVVPIALVGHLFEILVKVGCVALHEHGINFAPSLLVE